jgi:hypothetical protein
MEESSRKSWWESVETERAFVFYFHIFNRVQPVPQCEAASDDQPDENADPEKQPVGRKFNQQKYNYRESDYQASRPF